MLNTSSNNKFHLLPPKYGWTALVIQDFTIPNISYLNDTLIDDIIAFAHNMCICEPDVLDLDQEGEVTYLATSRDGELTAYTTSEVLFSKSLTADDTENMYNSLILHFIQDEDAWFDNWEAVITLDDDTPAERYRRHRQQFFKHLESFKN